jgi:hypothetical protein
MPNDIWLTAYREALATAPTDEVLLDTLEIRHPDVVEVFYLVRDLKDWDLPLTLGATPTTFEAANFNFTLPESGEIGIQEIQVGIGNVDRRIGLFIQSVVGSSKSVSLIYRPYLNSDLTQPQIDPPYELFLSDITITASQVVGRARFTDLVNRKFPNELYTRRRFPTLGR